jgi:hypothetical protein
MSSFKQYLAALASANRLGPDIEWVFHPGMLPESRLKWWGDFKTRPCAHEGIDICFYRTRTGPIRQLPAGARVPAWSSGTVLNICDDFLGTTLVVAPQAFVSESTRILEVYSHLSVCDEFTPGTGLGAGQIIAQTADPHTTGSVLSPHLHLSCIEVPAHIQADALNWTLFPRREKINVINPVFMG